MAADENIFLVCDRDGQRSLNPVVVKRRGSAGRVSGWMLTEIFIPSEADGSCPAYAKPLGGKQANVQLCDMVCRVLPARLATLVAK
jgi:hypothetical protein